MNRDKIRKKFATAILGTYRSIYYFFFNLFQHQMPIPDKEIKIDIIIPVIEKDLDILPLCLEGVRKCIQNTIADIYIVAPAKERIIAFASKYHLQFVDESTILGYSPKDIRLITNAGTDRSGWIFQQLLKLSGAIGTNRFFAVIDSDHILVQPHTFIARDRKLVFYQSKEFYYPYYANIKRLIGKYPYEHLSYIAHKMVFDKEKLSALKAIIESKSSTNQQWDKLIINSLDRKYSSSFSEFELYGYYTTSKEKIQLPWKQKELHKQSSLPSYEDLCRQYASSYLSVTFPAYLQSPTKDDLNVSPASPRDITD